MPRFSDDDREAKRCEFLYDGEFVVIPSAGEILARIVKEADTHPFNPIGHVIEHVVPEARAEYTGSAPAPSADGIALIAAERRRQIEDEGWTPEHDDEHDNHELSEAAACYALGVPAAVSPANGARVPLWPWDESWWKPGDRVRDLVKAGALIAAEIDRLQRAAAKEPQA
jgi:hypothetical protein